MYLVECQHLACHLPAVIQGDAHAIINLVPLEDFKVEHQSGKHTKFCYKTSAEFFHYGRYSSVTYHFTLLVRRHLNCIAHECDLFSLKKCSLVLMAILCICSAELNIRARTLSKLTVYRYE